MTPGERERERERGWLDRWMDHRGEANIPIERVSPRRMARGIPKRTNYDREEWEDGIERRFGQSS